MKILPYLVLTTTTFAQTLDPLIVEATREKKSTTQPDLGETRAELAESPGGTHVVEAAEYLTGRSSTMADTFALAPGVFAQSRFGSDEARLSIRGSGLQRTFHGRGVKLLQDGIPLNLADGSFDMQAIEPTAVSFIEILRGANALSHGSSTLGGSIDYISRNAANDPGGFARLEAGSWNYLRGTLAGGGAKGELDAFASFTWQSQDGFRDHARQENQRLFTNAGWKISDTTETRFYLSAIHTDSELPGALTKEMLEDDPRQANPGNLMLDQKRDFDLVRLANKTTITHGENTWNIFAAWSYKDLDHPIFQVLDQLSTDVVAGANFESRTPLFGHENRFLSGITLSNGVTRAARYLNENGSRGAMTERNDLIATNLESFIENQWEIGGGFTAVLGAAGNYSRRELEQKFAGPASYDFEYHNVSPRAGVRYDRENWQLFANASGSWEVPSFSETYTANTARDAQTAITYEIGSRGFHRFIRWDGALYHSEIKDELLAVIDPATGLSTTTNAGRTTHSGIELGTEIDLLGGDWAADPTHRFVFHAAYTYGLFEFENHAAGGYDYAGNKIAGIPPHIIRGELLWKNNSGYYVGPTFEWVPEKSWVDHRNTLSADPYALLGFKLGHRKEEGLSWFIEAKNLTDERYAATHEVYDAYDPAAAMPQRPFLPGDGRSVFCGIEWRW